MCWDKVDGPCGGEEDENWLGTGGVQDPLPVQGGLAASQASGKATLYLVAFLSNIVLQCGEEVSNVKSFFKLSYEIIMVFPFIAFFSVLVLQSFHLLQHTKVFYKCS